MQGEAPKLCHQRTALQVQPFRNLINTYLEAHAN